MVSDSEKKRRQANTDRAKQILNDPGFTVRQEASRQATKKARLLGPPGISCVVQG